MAPVTATTTGVARQIIDNPQLIELLERVSVFDTTNPDVEDIFDDSALDSDTSRINLEGLVGELERWPRWKFQEMADLYEWIKPLNAVDAAIRQTMKQYPALLLIGPAKKKKDPKTHECNSENDVAMDTELDQSEAILQAESEAEVDAVPPSVIHALSTILKFLSTLLRHAINKTLFNSVKELSKLLAAADDEIAALALEVLTNLVTPPLSHRLQSQETTPHTTALHAISNFDVHSRLMLLAKGWGTKGCGLGFATCVTTDDSTSGQGALPSFAGEVLFEFLPPKASKPTTIELSQEEMYDEIESDSESSPDRQKEKRRKMSGGSIEITGRSSREMKSTAALFFQCLDQIGGRSNISQDNMFAMLAHIRLASSFHSQSLRTAAVERRLLALISVLYAHPMQDVLVGYFQAQPELCTEIGDLVRPIVSSTAISATGVTRKRASSCKNDVDEDVERRQAAIASIVEPATTSNVPYNIRIIAVQALTALVARKDDSSSTGLSPVARLTNVLTELGVGKGQFLGLLPTLIRYSLASLNVFLSKKKQNESSNSMLTIKSGVQNGESSPDIEELGLDLGLTFLEATRAPLDDNTMESKAIEFVETVLSLAGSIISVSTGTTSLTDCGLVPALVSTIAQTSHVVKNVDDLPFELKDVSEQEYCSSLLKFITSQSIQILEVAIITHNPALMAFHDLKAVDLLVTLLHSEFEGTKEEPLSSDEVMKDEEGCDNVHIKLNGSTRVLLFSILNCLTIVFHHQETNPRSNNAPMSAANVLNRPDMTQVLMTIMNHVHSYGGVLGAVATTLLADIMNSDPKVVHYVYESGLADAFFRMMKGSQYVEWKECSKSCVILDAKADVWHEPNIPVTAELIMSLPNVIIALALTEDGRKRLLQVNPIPELLSLMCTSRFSMPHTRCMLNDMSSLIGSGLDELIRHVPNSKLSVIKALVATIERIRHLGQQVVDAESNKDIIGSNESRICLMHYASNIGQALEHILQNEENCSEFVTAGGVDAILNLHPLLIVKGNELLAHISSQSSPSIANLSHSTAATSLMSTIKRAAVNGDPCKVIKKIIHSLMKQLNNLKKAGAALRRESSSAPLLFSDEETSSENGLNASDILENIPKVPLNSMKCEDLESELLQTYADYLLEIINIEWLSQVLAEVVRVSCQRNSMTDVRSLEGSRRLDWQKELATPSLRNVLRQLGILYRSAISEVCRVRSSADYEDLDMQRWKAPGNVANHPASYKLRIVCADGAVVRDGIDIDSCDSVGNLEMGEEVLAFDRCINRSGIMRYRTSWGWVSEQTRGHGREPIAEIISVHGVAGSRKKKLKDQLKKRKPIDYGVADLRSTGASILARLQNSQCSLYTSLSRVTMTIARPRPSFSQQSQIGPHIGTLVREIGIFLRNNFSLVEGKNHLGVGGLAMYLGNMLSIFHSTIYEEKREKQYLNVLVLCNCLYHDGLHDSFLLMANNTELCKDIDIQTLLPKSGFYAAVRSVIKHGFVAIKEFQCQNHVQTNERLNRVIASSLPTALSLLRRLSSQNLLIDPSLGDILQKMNACDFSQFLCDPLKLDDFEKEGRIFSFRQDAFARSVHCNIGAIAHDFWTNKDLKHCPPHVLNSILSLVQDVLTCIEDSAKKSSTEDDTENSLRRQFRTFLPGNQNFNETEAAVAPQKADDSTLNEAKKEPSEAERKKKAEDEFDSKLLAINRECYKSFKESLSPTAIHLINVQQTCKTPVAGVTCVSQTKWLRDDEATNVVVGSFLLELCSRYPSERSEILQQLLVALESGMVIGPKGHASVIEGKYDFFTSVCHTSVLLLRAMPKTRICALKRNTVSLVLQCLRSITSKLRNPDFSGMLPLWVTPALLLLDVMAQPMVLPPKCEDDTDAVKDEKDDSLGSFKRRDDYDKVASEHKNQRSAVSKTAKRISSAFTQKAASDSKTSENSMLSNWTDFPAFAPLVSAEAADHCLSICLQLLKRQKRQRRTGNESIGYHLPPTTAHAIFMLLTKILCKQKVGSRCLRMGGADLLLGLHESSRFKGHVPLLTQTLRLMMEDEGTLQTEIEIELRSIVTKMLKKSGSSNGIPIKTFVQTATPLICRDPVVFLRAAATSIAVRKDKGEEETLVTLLSTEERTRNMRLVQECCRPSPHCSAKAAESSNKTPVKTPTKVASLSAKKKKESASEKTPRSKSPHHRQSKKSAKKERQEKGLTSGTPPNHMTNLLLNEAIKSYQSEATSNSGIPFLCVFEYLEILGDLLLVIPSCSAAICNYKLPTTLIKTKPESCGGLHYLLHSFLPQDRDFPNINGDRGFELEVEEEQPITRKRESFLKIKIAQSSSRLLVGLVARIGEGRRRVIAELSSALQTGSFMEHSESDVNKSMCTLQAWGELCLGLAAPRRSASSANDSSLSFEVLKVMAESRMAHSLLGAIKRISLEHPLAGSTAATLLKPLELLTRASVIDTLQDMFDKEEKKKESTQSDQHVSSTLKSSKPQTEGSMDDGMLADGFDPDSTPSTSALRADRYESISSHDGSGSENDDDIRSSNSEDSESSESDSNSEDDSMLEDDSMIEDDSMGEDEGEMEVVEDDEEIMSDSESDSENSSEDENVQMDFDDDFHVYEDEAQDDFLDNEEDDEDASSDEDEGWTNVDPGGLGGILFGSRNGAAPVGRPRQGGLMIEAAASVLNNILRSGEIQMEALAEIEQSLGIRLPPMNGGEGDTPRFRIRTTMQDRSEVTRVFPSERPSNRTQREGQMGAMPLIIQSTPPDNGFSSIGSIGRSGETNFMDILYCGPVFGAGGTFYDLLSESRNAEDIGDQTNETLPVPLSLDLQLFPGGPAACTQTRTTTTPHPLLAGVGLAPSNSLLSMNRRVDDQMNARSRAMNDPFSSSWPDFLVRLNRSPSINQNNGRASNGSVIGGLDSTASEFGRAFETALADVVSNHQTMGDDEAQNENAPFGEVNQGVSSEETAEGMNVASEVEETISAMQVDAHRQEANGSSGDMNDSSGNPETQDNVSEDAELTQRETQEHTGQEQVGTIGVGDSSALLVPPQMVCPPGMDPDVFAQLPVEMQHEIVEQHDTTANLAEELDEASGLDPEVLAALPEDMRREVIEQERQERQLRNQEQEPPADPSRAEDLDPASFIASLAPDLREEILVTADDEFLNSLPPDIQAEAQLLRERALANRHRHEMEAAVVNERSRQEGRQQNASDQSGGATVRRGGQSKRRTRTKIRVDCNRNAVTFISQDQNCDALITPTSMKSLIDLMFLLSPVRPQKLLQKLFHNLCFNSTIRKTIAISFIALLNDESAFAFDALRSLEGDYLPKESVFPATLIGAAPASQGSGALTSEQFFRKNRSTGTSAIAGSLPLSARGSKAGNCLPPVVARRIVMVMSLLTKNASRLSLEILGNFENSNEKISMTCLDTMLGLLSNSHYSMSSSNLDELLSVLENICAPLSSIPTISSNDVEPSKKEIDTAAASGKEFVAIPRAVVSPSMIRLLCSILRLESCKDSLFARVSNIARRLCRVEKNREQILKELASVAHGLGKDSIRDLRSLRIRLNAAVQTHYNQLRTTAQVVGDSSDDAEGSATTSVSGAINGTPSSAVTLSTNTTELKLLRVMQTLHSLCADPNRDQSKKNDEIPTASQELVDLLQGIDLAPIWEQLNACLSIVSVLEGVTKLTEEDDKLNSDDDDDDDSNPKEGKKLQNSVAGLLTRFLPTIEAFFVVNACLLDTADEEARKGYNVEALVGGESLMKFIETNKVLLNALLRSSPSLLDKGLRAIVQIPRCTVFLDFDVKRFWFKQQMRKLRSQASRRHGSLRLAIRRAFVFEDAYRQLSLRNPDELRGRLHVTFANEEGVDAGGLSREFFGILAKEMFNPNYALFTSTEDGCTFQPNQHSSINRDHLDYFRFVGRIVGKAVADGFLLDAHFTRSLYKHMLGLKPTYHDMQAIDPDYYKNLKMILDYNLEDIGLDLTFSTITHWFGRSQTVDLIPNGRNIPVTDKDKEKYVNLVCQHRMTTAIEMQIKAYLDGFYDLIKPKLISIFTPKELELLISGMPEIDIVDLKKNTEYHGYRVADKEIVWFWNIMFSLSKSDKAAFLQFVTGSSKVPLNGFSDLQGMRGTQKFAIHKAGGPAGALMSAHTCFNSLDLPTYTSEEEMKEKLVYAIKEGAGSFQFS